MAALGESASLTARVPAIRRAVEDQHATWRDAYPLAAAHLARIDAIDGEATALRQRIFDTAGDPLQELLAKQAGIEQAAADILLANPILRFEKLLVVKGNPGFNTNSFVRIAPASDDDPSIRGTRIPQNWIIWTNWQRKTSRAPAVPCQAYSAARIIHGPPGCHGLVL